jgi:hypothetical protein
VAVLFGPTGEVGRGLAVVADTGREDLVEAGLLGRVRVPGAVAALRNRLRNGFELALEAVLVKGTARDDSGGRTDREPLRAGSGRPVVEYPVPDVRTCGDLRAVGGTAPVGRRTEWSYSGQRGGAGTGDI